MSDPRIGVIYYNWPGFSLEQFLDFASKTGYRYFEMHASEVWNDSIEDPEACATEVAALVKKYGMQLSSVSSQNDFVQPTPELRQAQADRMKRVSNLAKILGTNVLRTEGGGPKDSVPESGWAESIADCLKRCCEWADDLDMYFAVDNHGVVSNDADLQVKVFESVRSKRVGANLDTMNYRWFGYEVKDLYRIYDMIAPWTLHTHMKDGFDSRENYKGAALGDGEVPLDYAVEQIKKAGYTGAWVAEYEGPEAEGGVGYAKCYDWLKANI